MNAPRPRWLTRRDAADYLRVSERNVDRFIRAGRLPSYRLNGRIRLSVGDLDALIGA